ncbi:MAG: hypothetical protein ACTSQO_02620 [Candidatus Helarchaeota archaeon]
MENENLNKDQKVKQKSKRTDVFKKSGSSRVIASASWTILMAVIGAIMLFIYQVIAGNYYGESGGLSYFSVTAAILAISTAISIGTGQAFIKIGKERYTIDGIEKGNIKIIQMSKINMLFGLIITGVVLIISVFNFTDPVFFIILIGASSGILITYIKDILGNMLGTLNRFDMLAIVGGIYGVIVCIFGFLIISLNLPPQFLAFIPTIMIIIMLALSIFFYNKIKTVSFKDLFFSLKKFPIEKRFAKHYIIYGIECTISNLVVFGIFSHIVLIMTFICYNYWGTFLGITTGVLNMTQILTLIDSFVFIEVALIFFSDPLNVEVSEAYAKKDYITMEKSINAVGRIGIIIALPISLAMTIMAPQLIKMFALGSVSKGSPPILDPSLFFQAWLTLSITSFGQAFYGLACIFGAALIGAGKAKKAAMGFGISAVLLFLSTPALIFLVGIIDDYFPIFGVSTYSLIGTGFAFLLSGIFVLPYLARATKTALKIKYDLRVKRLIPCLIILAIYLILIPIDSGASFLLNYFPTLGFDLLKLILLTIFLLIGTLISGISLCFFGVIGKGDGNILRDTFASFKMGILAKIIIKIGKFIYYLNPMNPK